MSECRELWRESTGSDQIEQICQARVITKAEMNLDYILCLHLYPWYNY